MAQLNPFLSPGDSSGKGGGRFIEDPAAVENIVFQTRGEPLTPFEDALADGLMAAYGGGAETLDQLVSALNAQGCTDRAGRMWTAATLTADLAAAATLFASADAAR